VPIGDKRSVEDTSDGSCDYSQDVTTKVDMYQAIVNELGRPAVSFGVRSTPATPRPSPAVPRNRTTDRLAASHYFALLQVPKVPKMPALELGNKSVADWADNSATDRIPAVLMSV